MKRYLDFMVSSFLSHLNYELSRPAEILDNIDIGDKSPRQRITKVKEQLLKEFPDTKPMEYNFVEDLYINRLKRDSYYNSSFEGFCVVFFAALQDLRTMSKETRENFKKQTMDIMSQFDHEKFGLNVNTFLQSESELREVQRDILLEVYKDDDKKFNEIWPIVYKQNLEHQDWIIEHFESLLLNSLNESNKLLHNILPEDICDELKKNNSVKPSLVPQGSVLFTDFKGFTMLTENMEPQKLVEELDICFKKFDGVVNQFSLEKIKTLGDGYMCAGGIPYGNVSHPLDICLAGLNMIKVIKELSSKRAMSCGGYWQVRVGIHTGPLVAGVIGEHKFSYDIWGDTVNTASRMESSGLPGEVNISFDLQRLVEPFFETEYRGEIPAKNKGNLKMYLLKGLKEEYRKDGDIFTPNLKYYEDIVAMKECSVIKCSKTGRDILVKVEA